MRAIRPRTLTKSKHLGRGTAGPKSLPVHVDLVVICGFEGHPNLDLPYIIPTDKRPTTALRR